MIKIYLDQKDYINISKAKLFSDDSKGYIRIYNKLMQLLDENKIVIYFSAVHVYESLKYEGDNPDKIVHFCDVIESMTRGNCIIRYDEIELIEINNYLSARYEKFKRSFIDQYPYGKSKDSISSRDFACSNDILDFAGQIKSQCTFNNPLDRLGMDLVLNDKSLLASFVDSIPEEQFDRLFQIDRKVVREAVTGTIEARLSIINELSSNSFNFYFLLLYFKQNCKDFADQITKQIENSKIFCDIINGTIGMSGRRINIQDLQQKLSRQEFSDIFNNIRNIVSINGLDISQLNHKEIDVAYFDCAIYNIELILGYLRVFNVKGNAHKRANQNDFIDLMHARASRYVDIFSTDKKIAPSIQSVAQEHGTSVVCDLNELDIEINNRLA